MDFVYSKLVTMLTQ